MIAKTRHGKCYQKRVEQEVQKVFRELTDGRIRTILLAGPKRL
jgi:hypothetical protein